MRETLSNWLRPILAPVVAASLAGAWWHTPARLGAQPSAEAQPPTVCETLKNAAVEICKSQAPGLPVACAGLCEAMRLIGCAKTDPCLPPGRAPESAPRNRDKGKEELRH
jgi:hypothetical protein